MGFVLAIYCTYAQSLILQDKTILKQGLVVLEG